MTHTLEEWITSIADAPEDVECRRTFVDWMSEEGLRDYDVGDEVWALMFARYGWESRLVRFISAGKEIVCVADAGGHVDFRILWSVFADVKAATLAVEILKAKLPYWVDGASKLFL